MCGAPTLSLFAFQMKATARASARAAVLQVRIKVTANAVAAIAQTLLANALPVCADLPSVAVVSAGATMLRIICECPATRVAAGEVLRALLAAAATVGVVRGEIRASATTTALP